MLKKFKVLILIASLAITLSLMSNTYSRYVASSNGNVEIEFAKWQLLVNNTDITTNTTSNISFKPTIEENINVAKDKVAPSSIGYFDVEIDPTNVDVSFNYTIDLNIENSDIPDLMITKYAIVPNDYLEGDKLTFENITDNSITNTVLYDQKTFDKFTVRIYFQWMEGEDTTMTDAEDTVIGNNAAINDTSFTINANIKFEQIIS